MIRKRMIVMSVVAMALLLLLGSAIAAPQAWSSESLTTGGTIQLTPKETVLVFAIGQSVYKSNGAAVNMDVSPMAREGRTLLPIRYIADPLGAVTSWDNLENKVTIKTKTKTIELWLNKNMARVNGAEVMIDPANPNVAPIAIPPGRTMMPLRFIAENLDCAVTWDNPSQSATISYPK